MTVLLTYYLNLWNKATPMSETILLGSQTHARAVLDRLCHADFPR